MFINVSNHPSADWSEKQISEAEKYGEITDLPFPMIDPLFNDDEINELVDKYYQEIIKYKDPAVMVMGEFVFSYRLITKLKGSGITVLASCSRRVAQETTQGDQVMRQSVFKFVKFREY